MTTSIHLCLGPCVVLVALLSLLQSSCFWHDGCSGSACGPAIVIVCIVLSLSKLSEFLILFYLETPGID